MSVFLYGEKFTASYLVYVDSGEVRVITHAFYTGFVDGDGKLVLVRKYIYISFFQYSILFNRNY